MRMVSWSVLNSSMSALSNSGNGSVAMKGQAKATVLTLVVGLLKCHDDIESAVVIKRA